MDRNVGGTDRIVRLVLGAVLVALGAAGYAGLVWVAIGPFPQFLTSVVLALIGIVLLASGLARWCPFNKLLGRDTCPA